MTDTRLNRLYRGFVAHAENSSEQNNSSQMNIKSAVSSSGCIYVVQTRPLYLITEPIKPRTIHPVIGVLSHFFEVISPMETMAGRHRCTMLNGTNVP